MIMTVHYFSCLITGGSPRSKLFTQEFMDEKFGAEHESLTGTKIIKGGYPDHGSGRYSMELGYSGWMEFMKAQRIHYNYLENYMQVVTGIAMTGLWYPRTACVWGGLYTLSRVWF